METEKYDAGAQLSSAIEEWNAQIIATHEELSRQIAAAQQHLDTISSDTGAAAAAAADAAEIARLHAEISARDNRIAALESEFAALRDEAATLSIAAEEAETARDSWAQCFDALQMERDRLAARLEAIQEERDDVRRKFAEAQAAVEALQLQTNSESTEMTSRDAQLEEAWERVAELESKSTECDRLEEELRQAIEERDEARAEAAALKTSAISPSPPPKPVDISKVNAFDARGHKKRMGQILVETGVLTEAQLSDILDQQASAPTRRFGTLVVEQGHTSEEVVARILAAQLRLPYTELNPDDIDLDATALIGPHLADLHQCLPIAKEDDRLTLAMANPLDLIAIEDVELAAKCRVEPMVAAPSNIRRAIAQYCYRPLE